MGQLANHLWSNVIVEMFFKMITRKRLALIFCSEQLSKKTVFTKVFANLLFISNSETHSVNTQRIRLMCWDTAGQEEFDALTSAYYRGTFKLYLKSQKQFVTKIFQKLVCRCSCMCNRIFNHRPSLTRLCQPLE